MTLVYGGSRGLIDPEHPAATISLGADDTVRPGEIGPHTLWCEARRWWAYDSPWAVGTVTVDPLDVAPENEGPTALQSLTP